MLGFTYLFKQNKITFVVDKIKCYKIFRTRLLLFVFPCSKNINHYVKNQVWIVMDHMVLTFHKSVVLCHPRRDYSIFAETIDFRKGSYLLFTLMSKRRDWNQLILWKVLQSFTIILLLIRFHNFPSQLECQPAITFVNNGENSNWSKISTDWCMLSIYADLRVIVILWSA